MLGSDKAMACIYSVLNTEVSSEISEFHILGRVKALNSPQICYTSDPKACSWVIGHSWGAKARLQPPHLKGYCFFFFYEGSFLSSFSRYGLKGRKSLNNLFEKCCNICDIHYTASGCNWLWIEDAADAKHPFHAVSEQEKLVSGRKI